MLAHRPKLEFSNRVLLLGSVLGRRLCLGRTGARGEAADMATVLEASSVYCQRVTRERARNFYYGFLLLPRPRRDAFCAVYAFMRYCDDVADGDDSVASKAARLGGVAQCARPRAPGGLLGRAGIGESLDSPAFHHAVQQYSIPAEYFHELIDGAEMDLSIQTYRTFEDLYQYCYRVASVVGLCSLPFWASEIPAAKKSGGGVRHRFPVDQHSARSPRGRPKRPHLSALGRPGAVQLFSRTTGRRCL